MHRRILIIGSLLSKHWKKIVIIANPEYVFISFVTDCILSTYVKCNNIVTLYHKWSKIILDFVEQFGFMPQVHLKKGKILQALHLPNAILFTVSETCFFFNTLHVPMFNSTITIRKLEIDSVENNLSLVDFYPSFLYCSCSPKIFQNRPCFSYERFWQNFLGEWGNYGEIQFNAF